MEVFNQINEDEKVVFFKINEDGSKSISQDYKVVGVAKTGSIRVKRNYKKDYKRQKNFWIKHDFLGTISTTWRETRNKPEYIIRILPIEF